MEPISIRELYLAAIVLGALAGLTKELRSDRPITFRSLLASTLWGTLSSTAVGMFYKEFIDKTALTAIPVIGLLSAMGWIEGLNKMKEVLQKILENGKGK